MRRFPVLALAALLLAPGGCGDGRLRTKGRLLRGGRPFVGAGAEFVQVMLVPVAPDGAPPANYFYAEVDQSGGTFWLAGSDKKGVPPAGTSSPSPSRWARRTSSKARSTRTTPRSSSTSTRAPTRS